MGIVEKVKKDVGKLLQTRFDGHQTKIGPVLHRDCLWTFGVIVICGFVGFVVFITIIG